MSPVITCSKPMYYTSQPVFTLLFLEVKSSAYISREYSLNCTKLVNSVF
ncbi:Uncharacterised protein [Vibrio cholerae]|nr:Uncharacterised protein [Vibrio cholerae]CSH81230.1 Uncharacterised protein [Vibrio cholerae]